MRAFATVSQRSAQSGAVLIVGMVMLLLLTIIGMAAIRGATLEEKMAGSQRDRALAFQSAEAALRNAEGVLNGASLPTWNTTGYGAQVASGGSPAFWDAFNWAANGLLLNLGLSGVESQPRYYVEQIDAQYTGVDESGGVDFESQLKSDKPSYFRVTSRGTGASSNTVVVLQSTYKR